MLPGIFIVLFFFALGELVGWLVNGFIPGSVIGMMLLFTALCLKWVKPERIKPVARFLCDNMALFFVPAGVGYTSAIEGSTDFDRDWLAGGIGGLCRQYGGGDRRRGFDTTMV